MKRVKWPHFSDCPAQCDSRSHSMTATTLTHDQGHASEGKPALILRRGDAVRKPLTFVVSVAPPPATGTKRSGRSRAGARGGLGQPGPAWRLFPPGPPLAVGCDPRLAGAPQGPAWGSPVAARPPAVPHHPCAPSAYSPHATPHSGLERPGT